VDATLGLNSVAQAVHFKTKAQINGVVLTKLDSAAKGGAILELCEQTKLPIYYIGTGEQMGDIEEFDKIAFTKSFLPDE
jgi:fused signal recognition particle receptor